MKDRQAQKPLVQALGIDSRSFDFDLADLQKLLDNGRMTQEEFRRARDVILSRTNAKIEPVKGFPVLEPPDQRES